MLTFENVRFSFKNGFTVLKNISFEMDKRDCVCLLGPNGTGKTTLLKCVLGYHRPESGAICIDGRNISVMSARERAKHIAYVAQSTELNFPYTVEEVVKMGRVNHLRFGSSLSKNDNSIAWEMMEHLGIEEMAERNFQTLSGGERQMVLIARALTQQADYLVLDEPTAALDYSNQVRILTLIRKLASEGFGILMTSHFPDHAFLTCTKVVMMKDGTVFEQGASDDVVTSDNLTELYHVPAVVADVVLKYKGNSSNQKVCVPILEKGEL